MSSGGLPLKINLGTSGTAGASSGGAANSSNRSTEGGGTAARNRVQTNSPNNNPFLVAAVRVPPGAAVGGILDSPNLNSLSASSSIINGASVAGLVAAAGSIESGKSIKCELEQMEHAFLDIDDEDDLGGLGGRDEEEEIFKNALAPDEWTYKSKEHSNLILERLNELRHEAAFCDVRLKGESGEPSFPVHKCVLSAISNYFKAMFSSNLAECDQPVIHLRGIQTEILEALIDYAYTSEIRITKQNVQFLLAASNLLEILTIRNACCKYMDKHMDENNSLGIQRFAEMHACSDLRDRARRFSLQNFPDVSASDEFAEIGQEQLIELISSDDLEVDNEESVFNAVVKWLESNTEVRETEFHRILCHVRLPLLSPYFLYDNVETLSIIKTSKENLRLLEEAKLYHLLPDRRSTFNSTRTRPRKKSGLASSIICVGGEDDKVVLRSVESWDPAKKIWKQLSCLPYAISKHGLVATGTNKMFLAGGEFPDGSASKSLWRFDPLLNVWQEMAPMSTSRSELGLAILDGFIYAIGGWEGTTRLNSVEKYDICNNVWKSIADLKVAVTSPAVVAHEGHIYVCGGAVLEDGDGSDIVQRLDVKTGEWSELSPMLISRSGSAAAYLNGFIYVVGGWHASTENTNKVERYDPVKNLWSFVCPLHERRYRPGISVLDGQIYVLGGEEGWDRYHDSIEVYDVENDKWNIVGHLPSARSWLSSVSLRVRSESLLS